MYVKVNNRVLAVINSLNHVSVTTDLWSSIAQDSYLSLTAHCINTEYEWLQACLHAVPFNENHSGREIAVMITNCLELECL